LLLIASALQAVAFSDADDLDGVSPVEDSTNIDDAGETDEVAQLRLRLRKALQKRPKALVQTSQGSSSSSAAHLAQALRAELVAEGHVRARLKQHLDEVIRMTHNDFKSFGRGIEKAKILARKSEKRLRAELGQAENKIQEAQKAEASLMARFTASQQMIAAQKASLAAVKASAATALKAAQVATQTNLEAVALAKKERGELNQKLASLKAEIPLAQKREAAAEDKAKSVEQSAEARVSAEDKTLKNKTVEFTHEKDALQTKLSTAQANLTALVSSSAEARRETASLMQELSHQQEQLREAQEERDELRNAQKLSEKKAASLLQSGQAAEASYSKSRDELASSRREIAALQTHLNASAKASENIRLRQSALQKQLQAVNASKSAITAKFNDQIRTTMLDAAKKIHDLEDQKDTLQASLDATKKDLTEASSANQKFQSQLQTAVEDEQDASQSAEALRKTAEANADARQQAQSKVASLSQQVASLTDDQTNIMKTLKDNSETVQRWKAEEQEEETAFKDASSKAQALEKENAALKTQVANLEDDGQRADELASQITELRRQTDVSTQQQKSLSEQLARIRDLKDQYSQQYDSVAKESHSWEEKADDLQEKLKSALNTSRVTRKQRNNALARVKEARSEEDEYFEENSRLQQQTESLTTKLNDAEELQNHTAEDRDALKKQVESLKSESTRDQQNSHATWVENQRELMQAKREGTNAEAAKDNMEAELAKETALLSYEQRKALGLPPLKGQKPAAAVADEPAIRVTSAVQMPHLRASYQTIVAPPMPPPPSMMIQQQPNPMAILASFAADPIAAPIVAVPAITAPAAVAVVAVAPQPVVAAPVPVAHAEPVVKAPAPPAAAVPVAAAVPAAVPAVKASPAKHAVKAQHRHAASLAAVPAKAAAPAGSRSALQKLADYFASAVY
jgi:chromosome segregation ATPase